MKTQAYTAELVVVHCGKCEATFGMDREFYEARRRDRRTWYCPNGHPRVFTGESREERLERELQGAQRRAAAAEGRAERQERRARAYKGQVTKIKRRVGNGVCPCCQRTFKDLAAHMGEKHPDWTEDALG